MENNMSKKIVLLDVDYTLLFQGEINETLIESLLNAQIKEVYLFTNGGLRDVRTYESKNAFYSRYDLIIYMEAKGFHVNVLTIMDPYFHPEAKKVNMFHDNVYMPLIKSRIESNKALIFNDDYSSEALLEYAYGDLSCEIAITLLQQKAKLNEN